MDTMNFVKQREAIKALMPECRAITIDPREKHPEQLYLWVKLWSERYQEFLYIGAFVAIEKFATPEDMIAFLREQLTQNESARANGVDPSGMTIDCGSEKVRLNPQRLILDLPDQNAP